MTSIEIPTSHAQALSTALSTSQGTPQLTINREAILDLDSSNAFEGKGTNDMLTCHTNIITRTREAA